MPILLSDLLDFIFSVFGHWQAWVTGGGVMAILSVWERLSRRPIQRRTYINLVVVGFLLVAFFLAWRDELTAKKNAQIEFERNTPKIAANYEYVYFVPRRDILVVLLSIRNIGSVPTVAYDYTLKTASQSIYPIVVEKSQTLGVMFITKPENKYFILLGEQFIQHRSSVEPIKPGSLIRGWLVFEGQGVFSYAGGTSSVNFRDILGRVYSIPIQSITVVPPLPKELDKYHSFPDITYPFRSESWVKQMEKEREKK